MNIDIELLQSFCDEAIDLLSRWEMICLELAKEQSLEPYQELFRIAHNLKGGSRAVGLAEYGDFVHKIEDGITLLRDGKIKTTDNILAYLLDAQKHLHDWAEQLKTNAEYQPQVEKFLQQFVSVFTIGASDSAEHSNDNAQSINNVVESNVATIEAVVEKQQTDQQESQINEKKSQETKVKKESSNKKTTNNETIRVSAQKLDQLIQVIGELSIHQSIVWHTRNESQNNGQHNKMFTNSIQLSQKLTKELYDKALSLRMQPLQSIFQRLERNIVELSTTLNKNVHIDISGGDVEIDKTMLEKLIDPLTHIVRNAIDHGIETADIRTENGKTEQGTIIISAKQDTFGVELIIKDDGKGMSTERIRKKAEEKNLIKAADQLSKKDILNLIFLAGFSTAEKITDVSGRGVGMDVVRRTLEDLQGTISIDSEEGKGSTFTITIPTSVSIIDSILIQLNGNNYVIPVGAVEEVININSSDFDRKKDMIIHNSYVLPLQDLDGLLKKKTKLEKISDSRKAIMICQHQNKRIGILVDKVIGQQQIVIRPLNENINGAFGFLGGTILGNGEPGLIIDLPSIADKYFEKTNSLEQVA